jgi:hypothetical protein
VSSVSESLSSTTKRSSLMSKYLIAGIKLEFNYCFQDFFADRIPKYQIGDELLADYQMTVRVSNQLNLPKGELQADLLLVSVYQEDTLFHRVVYADEDRTNIRQVITYTEDFKSITIQLSTAYGDKLAEMEYVISGLYFFEIALRENRIAIHASAMEYQQSAVLISGPSGTGKSTHVGLWQQYVPEVRVINDDKPLLVFEGETIYVAGSPWSGKTNQSENLLVPLKAIVFLRQGRTNTITLITPRQKMTELMRNVYRPAEEAMLARLLDGLEVVLAKAEIFEYLTNISESAVITLYDHLFGGFRHEN